MNVSACSPGKAAAAPAITAALDERTRRTAVQVVFGNFRCPPESPCRAGQVARCAELRRRLLNTHGAIGTRGLTIYNSVAFYE